MKRALWGLYARLVIGKPVVALTLVAAVCAALATHIPKLEFDASADSLLLEDDADLRYYRQTITRYGADDFLVVAYTPAAPLFTPAALARLGDLQRDLEALPGTRGVRSILNAPLLHTMSLANLAAEPGTLGDPDADLAAARRELLHSPLYANLLVGADERSAMLLVSPHADPAQDRLLAARERLRAARDAGELDAAGRARLANVAARLRAAQAARAERERRYIAAVRAVVARHRGGAEIFLGGVPMIVADIVAFIENDIVNFGAAALVFFALLLAALFRRARWVALPMVCCALPVAALAGLLALLGQRVSVISANFAALLLVVGMSMTVHLTVRWRETAAREPGLGARELAERTMRFMFKPCLYTSATTAVAFVSLIVSGIRPVIDFGHIMTFGVALALVLVFVVFPAALRLLKPERARAPAAGGGGPGDALGDEPGARVTRACARLVSRRAPGVALAALAALVFAASGIAHLTVENRFIDYFKSDTEIFRGMLKIDRDLGGTTSLDLILDAPPLAAGKDAAGRPAAGMDDGAGDDFDYLDADDGGFAYLGADDAGAAQARKNYWLNPRAAGEIARLHDRLEGHPAIGKTLSPATFLRVAEELNGAPLNDVELQLLPALLPEAVRALLYAPYLSADGNQLRFNMRVIDSDPALRRAALLDELDAMLRDEFGYDSERFRLGGALVLYNNMLQSLFASQIATLGMVFAAILLMFVALFRSLRLAVVALVPNLLPAAAVLGFMGWAGIPLDLMTITIAAISVGIAVDNTIHYVVRFKREFPADRCYRAAVRRCHGSIGRAVYFTSVVIVGGFSTLALSNFVPTIYFGLLTGLAILASLLAALLALPALLILCKPLGPEMDPETTLQAAQQAPAPRP